MAHVDETHEDVFKKNSVSSKNENVIKCCDDEVIGTSSESNKKLTVCDSKFEEKTNYNGEENKNVIKSYEDEVIGKSSESSKKLTICDSESEEETNYNDENKNVNKSYEDEVIGTSLQRRKKLTICDSESEEETDYNVEENKQTFPDPESSNKGKKSKLHSKKMSGKEALQQKMDIISESHRRVRESKPSLPYHKPKTRSLKEFLQMRPRFSAGLLNNTKSLSPSIAIKMTTQQLELVSKNMEEREKAVEEFFKSDDESVDENENSSTVSSVNGDERQSNDDEDYGNVYSEKADIESELIHDNKIGTDQNVIEISKVGNETDNFTPCKMQEKDDCTNSVKINEKSEEIIDVRLSAKNSDHNLKDYEFNLDDLDIDLTHSSRKDEEPQHVTDHVEQNFHCPGENDKTELILLNQNVATYKPCLSGGPDQVIDFSEDVVKPNEVTQLMKRFMKHNARPVRHEGKVQLNVVSVSEGKILKETVAMNVNNVCEPVCTTKTGTKQQNLRDQLQNQMIQHRSEMWQRKLQSNNKTDLINEPEDEVSDSDVEPESLKNELTCSELEERCITEDVDENVQKNCFINNQAEDTDIESDDAEENESLSSTINDITCNDSDSNEDQTVKDIGNLPMKIENDESSPRKKKLKRIISFSSDSDDDDSKKSCQQNYINTYKNNKENDSCNDDGDSQSHQGPHFDTPEKELSQQPELSFLTPVFNLTGLQNLNSGSKFLHDSPVSQFSEQSPLHENSRGIQKKLFTDEKSNTTKNIEELKIRHTPPEHDVSNNYSPTTQEILDICSGTFVSQSQDANHQKLDNKNKVCSYVEASSVKCSDITLSDTNSIQIRTYNVGCELTKKAVSDIKTDTSLSDIKFNMEILKHDNENDKLISHLLNEEKMNEFKKKFHSPVVPNLTPEVQQCIFNSSDEDEDVTVFKKKGKKKLNFSDDEDEIIDSGGESEDVDNQSNKDDVDIENILVEYDSEENEIDVCDQGTLKNKYKVTDFVDNEAELSESDWDSADEDERGLDELEFESGDVDKLDQNKIRKDLERIHMRQVLDDDKREVKILQELLLDDGELHGAGRERQFKWKHIDSTGTDVNQPTEEDDQNCLHYDDENEGHWRKIRYEREIYLNKQKKTEHCEEDITLSTNSQVFKLGRVSIKRKLPCSEDNKPSDKTSDILPSDSLIKQPMSLLNKRGSFLTRSDKVLTRLAEFTKTTNIGSAGGSKTHRSLIFQPHSFDPNNTAVDKKRKSSSGKPNVTKKLKLDNLNLGLKQKTEL